MARTSPESTHWPRQLERVLLLPEVFGGKDVPQNVVFVPSGIGEIKRGIDQNVIAPLAASGKVTKYSAKPEYSGRSFIPIAIRIVASVPGHFGSEVKIWGEALNRS